MFSAILFSGIFFVVIQGIWSWWDGFLTQAQMRRQGIRNGYSFMEHGGMWADIFFISPLVAYLTTHYRFAYTAWWSLLILIVVCAVTVSAGIAYNKIGLTHPVPHSHHGRTTPVGWLHGIYGVVGLWIFGMFYLTPIYPAASARDLVWISAMLTPFFFLGIVDFNKRWVFMKGAKIQLALEILVLWIVTTVRIVYH